MFYSPLRYPGGKNKLAAFIARVCVDNEINGLYIEPYAGGASVALFLLFEGFVDKIIINDKDRSIYAFWHSVLNNSKKLCYLIESTDITVENWRKLREVQQHKEKAGLLELGFSTLFMNRTNISGIINGGLIGGMNQDGNYKMNCRFNKSNIIDRIQKISKKRKSIQLFKKDALKLIDKIECDLKNNNAVFYFDPPYYLKASSLYLNHYKDENHKIVSERIKKIKSIKWIVSYDNIPEIQELYSEYKRKEYTFKHTAYKIREGREILFFSSTLVQPDIENWDPIKFKIHRKNNSNHLYYKN